ncbi:MAG: hypothetical protein Q7K39_03160 [Candidatus Magasanikbacteria bacterium]|nr:hypothetical protein [Candidatus Magasanikbacteria bacterium]
MTKTWFEGFSKAAILAATLLVGFTSAGCEERKASLLITMTFDPSVSEETRVEVRQVGTVLRLAVSGVEELAGDGKLESQSLDTDKQTLRYRPLVQSGRLNFHMVFYSGRDVAVPLIFGRGAGDIQAGIEVPVAVVLFPCAGDQTNCPGKIPDKKCTRDDECNPGFSCDVPSGRCLQKQDQPDAAAPVDMATPPDLTPIPDLQIEIEKVFRVIKAGSAVCCEIRDVRGNWLEDIKIADGTEIKNPKAKYCFPFAKGLDITGRCNLPEAVIALGQGRDGCVKKGGRIDTPSFNWTEGGIADDCSQK